MGFLAPTPPPVDVDEWKKLPHLERIKPLAQDWAVNGFGTPTAIYLLYVVKLIFFVFAGALLISAATPGLGGLGNVSDWWYQPIVFQKVVVWLILWEALGLGCGSMPLTFRFLPPIGGPLYWLRPGTMRLPPWPDKVPGTRGTARTLVDVALYAGVLGSAVFLLFSDGEAAAGASAGRLDPVAVGVLIGFIALLGLRDKVAFLATRPEVYVPFLVIFLFPLHNMIVAAQFVSIPLSPIAIAADHTQADDLGVVVDLPLHIGHRPIEHAEARECHRHRRRRDSHLRRDIADIFDPGGRAVRKRHIENMSVPAGSGCGTRERDGAQTGQDDRNRFAHQASSNSGSEANNFIGGT